MITSDDLCHYSYSYSYSLQLDDPRFLIRIKYVNADNYVIDRQRQKAKVYISGLVYNSEIIKL